jgi:hypothetical protein
MFLHDYIDKIFSESSKVPKKRPRVYDPNYIYDKEPSAPLRAPKWTVRGYNGSLKAVVENACKQRSSVKKIHVKSYYDDPFKLAIPSEYLTQEVNHLLNRSQSKERSKSKTHEHTSSSSQLKEGSGNKKTREYTSSSSQLKEGSGNKSKSKSKSRSKSNEHYSDF